MDSVLASWNFTVHFQCQKEKEEKNNCFKILDSYVIKKKQLLNNYISKVTG